MDAVKNAVKNFMMLEKLLADLLIYKNHLIWRAGVVVGISSALYFYYSFRVVDFIYTLIFLSIMEYLTLDMIFVRNFYPANQFAEQIYPDRESIGNKTIYAVVYLVYIIMFLIGFSDLLSKY